MHIAVNTRLLLPNKLDGIGWFTHEVLQRLVQMQPDWKFTFLFDRPFDKQFIYGPNVQGITLFPPTRHPLLYRLYFEHTLPRVLQKIKPDLLFSPDGFLTTKTDLPQVPVIHDLNFEHRPQDLPPAYRKYYQYYFPLFAKKASHIISVSQFSAEDIARTYQIAPQKISVAHNGFNPKYRKLSNADKLIAKKQFVDGSSYFIFVGNFSFRKNIHGIIRSFGKYKAAGGRSKLLLVGNPLWRYHEMDHALEECTHRNEIIFAGRLEIDQLVLAMGAAQALLFPSYFEGFGIPILEAFAAGIPVVTSPLTSLPEVAGKGALYCDPDNHDEISFAMKKIESSENEVINLVTEGAKQLSAFSWENTANKVQKVLFDIVQVKKEGGFDPVFKDHSGG